MRRARASGTLAAALVTAAAASAHAVPGRFELSWSAPDSCPSNAWVEQRVARILNRPPVVREGQVLLVHARVGPPEREQRWRVEIETNNGQRQSSRSLDAASCEELADATALLVAILIEPHVEPESPPAPPPPPKPVTLAPAPSPPRALEPSLRFVLGGFAASESGLMPRWAFGLGVEGGVAWRALHANVSAASWLPVETTAPDSERQGARFRAFSTGARMCVVQPLQPRIAGGLCGGVELAFLSAHGFGPGVQEHTEPARFVSLAAGPQLGWAATRNFGLRLRAEVLVPLGSRSFVFEGSAPATIHSPGPGALLTLGVQWTLGGNPQ
jgi:hypothetical protein